MIEAADTFVVGENLAVLSGLRETRPGTVKLIYTDPPYNTGRKLVYADDLSSTDWLAMMRPRLALARDLLTADGLIAVSIDDNELHHLLLLMHELFGSENFVSILNWRK